MVVAFDFGRRIALIKFVGTHAEYDRIDALTVAISEGAHDGNSSD
jgi:mRNA interferase HigB